MFNPINSLLSLFSLDIGIDLGTANTLVSVRNKGIIINEPSWVAIERKSRRVLAIGTEAREMVGRTPGNIVAIRPLRDGVISDFDITEKMLHYFIRKAHSKMVVSIPRPRVVVGIPSGVTEVEKRAVHDASVSAGAREAYLIEEPMASAIGAGLAVTDSVGSMVVDIGGGTTEVAVIALGGIVLCRSIRVAGDEMDEAVKEYVRDVYGLEIGLRTAEETKIAIGSAYALEQEVKCEIRGKDIAAGLPRRMEITSEEIREALNGPIQKIIEAVMACLDKTPPELASDLIDTGITMVGGGSLLPGIDKLVAEQTGLIVRVADDPLTAVARGTANVLEKLDEYEDVLAEED